MKFRLLSVCLFIQILLVNILIAQPDGQWRGLNRDGNYSDPNLLNVWPEEGPQLLWLSEEIGNGYGSPVVVGNRVYVNGEIDAISHLFVFDLNGKLEWKAPNGPEFSGTDFSAGFPGSRSAPTIQDNSVYVCSGMGRIACFNAQTGAEKWAVEMEKDLGGKNIMFGYSESLLVDEKLLYCFPGGTEINVAALDKLTGKLVWSSKALADGVSYCSPMMIQLPERDILVTLSREYLMGLDAKNGELLWSVKEDSVKLEGTYCNTPVYRDGYIYGVSGVEKGTGAYKLKLSADGKTVQEEWRNTDVKNGYGGFVVLNDRLFCASKDNKLKALELQSGKETGSLSGMKGIVIAVNDKLICYSENGRVNFVDPSGEKMELVSKFKIEKGTKEHFAHPAIANGVLYVRHGNALMAYSIR